MERTANRNLLLISVLTFIIVGVRPDLDVVQNLSTNCSNSVSGSHAPTCSISLGQSTSNGRQRKAKMDGEYYLTPRPAQSPPLVINATAASIDQIAREQKGENGSISTSSGSRWGRGLLSKLNPFPVFSFIKSFVKKPSVQYVPYKLTVKIPKIVKPILYLTNDGTTTDSSNGNLVVEVNTGSRTDSTTPFPTFDEESYHHNKYAAYAKYYGLNGWGWKSKGKGHGKKNYNRHKGYSNAGHKKKYHHGGKRKGKGHHNGHGWDSGGDTTDSPYGWGSGGGGGHKKKGHKGKNKGHVKGHHKGKGHYKGKGKGSNDYGWGSSDHSSSSKKGHKSKKGTYPKYYDSLGNAYTYSGYGKGASHHYHKKAYQKGQGSNTDNPILHIPYYRKGSKAG